MLLLLPLVLLQSIQITVMQSCSSLIVTDEWQMWHKWRCINHLSVNFDVVAATSSFEWRYTQEIILSHNKPLTGSTELALCIAFYKPYQIDNQSRSCHASQLIMLIYIKRLCIQILHLLSNFHALLKFEQSLILLLLLIS